MIKSLFSWMNLSVTVRLDLAFQFKEFEQERAKNRQGTRNDLATNNTNIAHWWAEV